MEYKKIIIKNDIEKIKNEIIKDLIKDNIKKIKKNIIIFNNLLETDTDNTFYAKIENLPVLKNTVLGDYIKYDPKKKINQINVKLVISDLEI